MKLRKGSESAIARSQWQKTQYANLVRYVPSGTYFARVRVAGKLIRKSLKTDALSVAKLRLADLEKVERQAVENQQGVAAGKMTFDNALKIYQQRIQGSLTLKPRSKDYYGERITSLLRSWPQLKHTDIRKITKTDCLNWAAGFGRGCSATAFNNTVKVLRDVLDIGIETGARYDNPAKFVERASAKPKKLQLPEPRQFPGFVSAIKDAGGRFSRDCADLVCFLAYGGFRKGEAATITWGDCDFAKGEITVRGDPETGTKNWGVRQVPIIPDMRKLLERIRGERPGEPSSVAVMKVRECQKAMDRATKLVGMRRITHHDLRHLFATRCIESGVDIPTVSRWLGHKDGGALAMKTYGHLRNEHSQEMAKKVRF